MARTAPVGTGTGSSSAAARGGPAARRMSPAGPGADAKRTGGVMVALGVVIFGVAVAVTVGTYSHAQQEGGTYFVAWGPALLGLILLGAGISRVRKAEASLAAQWHPDPTGRHQHRYWDGAEWTDRVGDGGEEGSDPVEEAAARGSRAEQVERER